MTLTPPGEAKTNADAVKYRLAVAAESVDQDRALPILQQVLGFNAIDGRTRLKHIPAVWVEGFPQTDAESAAARLVELGIEAVAVPVDQIPELHPARTLHHVECAANGLVINTVSGDVEQTIAWDRVKLLSIADIVDAHARTEGRLPDGVFRHDPGITERKARPEDHGLELWILCDQPFEALRIVADQMNYEYLGERCTSNSASNFQNLVTDLLRYARNASTTPSAREYLNSPSRAIRRLYSAVEHRDAVIACWCVQLAKSGSDA